MNNMYRKYPVTFIMIMAVVLIYVYTSLVYSLDMNVYQGIEAGGFNPVLVVTFKQYYRLISANFIHFGIMHIFCNAYSLYNLGTVMEYILGFKNYLIVLLVSMFTTTLFPLVLYVLFRTGENVIMGGISGVIFGLIGSLLALAYLYRGAYSSLFKQILPSFLLVMLISLMVPSVSLTGHIGGMIGGFLVTYLLKKPKYKENNFIN